MNQKHLIAGNLARLYKLGALFRGEEIDDIQLIKNLAADTIYTPYALDNPDGVPRNVIINYKPRSVKVESFRYLVRSK